MGLERLYARTNTGFELKVLASIIALACTNMYSQSRYIILGMKKHPHTELFERDPYFDTLHALLRGTTVGQGCLVLLGGEAGVGKTALVHLFCAAAQKSAHVHLGACDPLSTPRPLGPLLDIAAEIGGHLESLVTTGAPRDHIFRSFLAVLTARSRATLLVFEDMHWADEATLDFVRFLGRRLHTARALLIATYRDDEIGPRHPLRVALGDLATSVNIRRMILPPLSIEAVRLLAAGSRIDAVELHRQTGGNPFFVTEVLASKATGIPATVRDAVLARAARLSPMARNVLDAAAVSGPRVETWLLKELVGAEAEAVDACIALGVLQMHGNILSFRHELGRIAVLEAIAPYRRLTLHRNVLEALRAATTDTPDFGRLAHHAEAAGEREAVLMYAPLAARGAVALKAHREAVAQYARALRFAETLPPDQHALLLEAWSYECYLTEQLNEAVEGRQAAIAHWRTIGDHLKEGENLRWLSRLLWFIGQNAAAWEAAEQAIRILEGLPRDSQLAMAYSNRAQLHMLAQQNAQAIVWGEKAIELAEQVEDTATLSHALNNIGTARIFAGQQDGWAQLKRSLQLAQEAGLEEHVARAYTNLASGAVRHYQLSAASRYLDVGITYCIEHDLDSWRIYMSGWRSVALFHQGYWSEATAAADQVLHHPHVSTVSRIQALVILGRVRARRGDPGVADALDLALEIAAPTRELQRIGQVRAARAEAAWLSGDMEKTQEEAGAVYDLAIQCQDRFLSGELALWLWRAGDRGAPQANAAEPFSLQVAGKWSEAAASWRTLGCPYEAAQALADSGDETALRQAFTEFERLGAYPAAAAVSRRLRELGAQSVPRGARPTTRTNPAHLTARELEILRLIADGLRNAAIAERLSLSPKTVDHHVSSILSKLGVNTRTAAVREAVQMGLVVQDREPEPPR
jgi:DNA-binding CsgD family transcriptional regulator